MATGLVGQYQVTTFPTPVNGTSPIDANVVRGNDNTTASAYDNHDNDGTIHFQSSVAASRPIASTAGRKWIDSDTLRVYYDTGVAWSEIAYLSLAGGGTAAGPITATRLIASADITSAVAKIVASDGVALNALDIAVTSILGGLVSVSSANASGSWVSGSASVQQSAATSGSTYASHNVATASHTSGTVSALKSVSALAAASGSGGTTTTLIALEANLIAGAGATVTTGYGVFVIAPSGAGTFTNTEGVHIGNMGSGANNYAIRTGTGLISCGDHVVFAASTTSRSSFRVPAGTAPTSPVAGETWNDGTNLTVYAGITAANGKIGYATGSGSTVTQATNKTTGVTLNKVCGQITMNNSALSGATGATFVLTNSFIAATDVVEVSIASGATSGAYIANTTLTSAGTCEITLRNQTAGILNEAVVLNFAIKKSVNA